MKNREWLLKQNEYDLLNRFNAALMGFSCDCVMDVLTDDADKRCRAHSAQCYKCIQTWLNEERK